MQPGTKRPPRAIAMLTAAIAADVREMNEFGEDLVPKSTQKVGSKPTPFPLRSEIGRVKRLKLLVRKGGRVV